MMDGAFFEIDEIDDDPRPEADEYDEILAERLQTLENRRLREIVGAQNLSADPERGWFE